jgi:hypothetical protein
MHLPLLRGNEQLGADTLRTRVVAVMAALGLKQWARRQCVPARCAGAATANSLSICLPVLTHFVLLGIQPVLILVVTMDAGITPDESYRVQTTWAMRPVSPGLSSAYRSSSSGLAPERAGGAPRARRR